MQVFYIGCVSSFVSSEKAIFCLGIDCWVSPRYLCQLVVGDGVMTTQGAAWPLGLSQGPHLAVYGGGARCRKASDKADFSKAVKSSISCCLHDFSFKSTLPYSHITHSGACCCDCPQDLLGAVAASFHSKRK